MTTINQLLQQSDFSKSDLVQLLHTEGDDLKLLYKHAEHTKLNHVGNKVYLRGLLEYSNLCGKNCLYCGIRQNNQTLHRYTMTENEIETAIRYAYEHDYGSIVVQSGERNDKAFVEEIDKVLQIASRIGKQSLGITLSCGEQTKETYRRWFELGATRYLLRIETSNENLYYSIHPRNAKHDFSARLQALSDLQACGYQTGTGVLIGFPNQSIESLADDLLFMKQQNIDMCGMGPYVVSENTPLQKLAHQIPSIATRVELSLKMVALLRIIMPKVNIAATTAMQTLDKLAREKAIRIGANVLMPNLTPTCYREDYSLYQNKPGQKEQPEDSLITLQKMVENVDCRIAFGEKGSSKHYSDK